jgi:hypothetical protein
VSILLSTLSLALAAFAVWLGVRIVNRRELWAKRTAVVLIGVLVGYPLTIRPACWFVEMEVFHTNTVAHAYCPLVLLLESAPRPVDRLARWYAGTDLWGVEWLYVLSARLDYEQRMGYGVP